jgi:ABC-2 type transport system ATP-binding protein
MSSSPGIEAAGLAKSFGHRTVLRGLDLVVGRGTLCALLGPNGAGKTTAVRILSTLLRPDKGTARVCGIDIDTDRRRARQCMSLTGQETSLDTALSGKENLITIGRLAGLGRATARDRSRELIELLDLEALAGRRTSMLSGGQRRRLDLAAGLMGRPQVMFLDEPTTGLDPRSRQATWDLVRDVVSTGVTVLLTTQYLDEADALADQVAVIDRGVMVANGTPAQLKAKVSAKTLDLTASGPVAFEQLAEALGGRQVTVDRARLTLGLATDGSAGDVFALLGQLGPARQLVQNFDVHEATLDQVFFALTGRPAENSKEEVVNV